MNVMIEESENKGKKKSLSEEDLQEKVREGKHNVYCAMCGEQPLTKPNR